ncbi:uncharacterized protein NPIL_573431 [Nephila pilipes]|uniref:Uncharacterized protein n=1 Tax=Nephila pilipes TaxID=299642 RepID=A0A8X6R1E2_NEPPI|nr:uncharacterized protein NPIL_176631 [Nephila pilipes]GFU43813.1 uncharacterized protein NPIL_568841 [Nephila pilipes]GFU48416.1 uncharacterized protein NPIL_573431 [Nephila pilipes]
MLADKLETFDKLRRSLPSGPKRHVKASEALNVGRQVSSRKSERLPKREYSHEVPNERYSLKCYGCGKQRVIKFRCPKMYQVFKDKELIFQETTLAMSLADGQQTTGTDFLSSAGLILDVKNACWYFWDNPTHKYPFGEELDTPSIAEMSSNTCQLKEGKGESLTSFQKDKLNLLLESFQNVYVPGEKQQTS